MKRRGLLALVPKNLTGVCVKALAAYLMILGALWGVSAKASSSGIPSFSENVPTSFRLYLTSALEELFSVKGEKGTALQMKIFGGPVSGETYRKWFAERVRRIEMKSDGCSYTARVDSDGPAGVIYISSCVNQNVGPESKVYWLSVLFHEARHLEFEARHVDAKNKHWHHDVVADSSGMAMAYDRSPMGAYGVEKVFAFNLANFCDNCSADFKQQASDVFEDATNWRKISPEAARVLSLDASDD